ncbi:MAG: acyl-CoA synthetase [Actinomycetes bacterium]
MDFNLATLFENAVDHFPDREYIVAAGKRRTYREMEERANQLAHALQNLGVGPGDHVGIYSYNSVEWIEILWATFKIRAVWININYRYVEDELRYLFTNADLKVLFLERSFADNVSRLAPELPTLEHIVVIEDDSTVADPTATTFHYEDFLATGSPDRDFAPRSNDDIYMLYTGGTTGMPKGVVWQHKDVFYALGGGWDSMSKKRMSSPDELIEKGNSGFVLTHLPVAPLMHGATQWCVMGQSFVGSKIVLMPRFEPSEVWSLVDREKVNSIMITGDAMGKPMIEHLAEDPSRYDTSSLLAVVSSAALFTPPVKDHFFEVLPNIMISDAIGSSESGNNGLTVMAKGQTAMKSGPTVTRLGDTVVFDEDLKPVEPGSGVIGRIARSGDIPLRYYKAPEKTAETFFEVDGVRYVMPGDFATVEADGSVTLLGRGNQVINSGGEKIFPEEVEAAVRSHPDVLDSTVVGAPDERWGQTVAAVVTVRPGTHLTLASLQEHCRGYVAGYKVPRRLFIVDAIERSPAGKPDYRWAANVVVTATATD